MIQKNDNLRRLQSVGTSYFKQSLHEEKEIRVSYNRNMIQIGRTPNNSIARLDTTEPGSNVIISKNGGGKTFLGRGLLNRYKATGNMSIFIPTDIKNEFWTNSMPLQAEFHHLLLAGEKPTAEKIIALRPTYFKTIGAELQPNKRQMWYSPDLTKIAKSDFLNILNLESSTDVQKSVIERLWNKFIVEIKTNPETFSFSMFIKWIDEMVDLTDKTKNSMKRELEPLIASNFYEPKHRVSLTKLIQDGYTVCFNLEGYDQLSVGKFLPNEVIITIGIRELILARRQEKISRLVIFLEEAKRFTKYLGDLIKEGQQVNRKYGVDWWLVFQDYNDVPISMLKESNYIFVPSNLDLDSFQALYLQLGMATNIYTARNQALQQFRRMPPNSHYWTMFMKNERRCEIFKPLAPRTHHAKATQ